MHSFKGIQATTYPPFPIISTRSPLPPILQYAVAKAHNTVRVHHLYSLLGKKNHNPTHQPKPQKMSTRDLRAQSGRPTYTSFPAYASTVESRARGSDPNADTDSYPHHRRRRRRRRGRNGSPPEDSFLEHDDSSSSDSDETIRAVGGPRPVAEEEIHRRAPERGEVWCH